MDDVISRQDTVNELREYITEPSISDDESEIIGYNDGIELAISVLSTMPSAQQWIPCSERLPDQNGKYLVVGRQKAINILKFDGGRWYGKWGVVAWMPLPKPYKESENG